jgi:hypothetical protein
MSFMPQLVPEKTRGKLLEDEEDVTRALRRLNRLTQAEVQMALIQNMEVVYCLINNLEVVMDGEQSSPNSHLHALVKPSSV